MHGFWYSASKNYSFTSKEIREMFWTSLVFTLIMTAYFSGMLYKAVPVGSTIRTFLLLLIFICLSMFVHVSLQKLVGIKLGYKVTYGYWLNGILISLFLSVLSLGLVPLLSTLILPGSVVLEPIPSLRLGKFRYGLNAKDIARISIAGPISHVLIVIVLGVSYLHTRDPTVFRLISISLLLAIFSTLPLPKLDIVPSKMDGPASDGFGIFFFSRTAYILSILTVLVYALLIWVASVFSFITAFVIAGVATLIYLASLEQKN